MFVIHCDYWQTAIWSVMTTDKLQSDMLWLLTACSVILVIFCDCLQLDTGNLMWLLTNCSLMFVICCDCWQFPTWYVVTTDKLYRSADKSLAQPGRKQATATEDFDVHISCFWYMIYLLTAIGLSPSGSSTVHIYTQTIHRTTQNKQCIEQRNNLRECGPCPVLARFTLAFALQLRKKHGKTSVRV